MSIVSCRRFALHKSGFCGFLVSKRFFNLTVSTDLLDPTPWVSLQGQLLHLFMCAHNEDVDLFESLTWIRAYENYVNVASVKHGSPAGVLRMDPATKLLARGRDVAWKQPFSCRGYSVAG